MPEYDSLISILAMLSEYLNYEACSCNITPCLAWISSVAGKVGKLLQVAVKVGKLLQKDALRVSGIRSLYLSVRYGGLIVILRGTRLRIDRGARIRVPRGCRLVIGKCHVVGAPSSLEMKRNARLTVHGRGRVSIARGARISIMKDAHLEIGHETAILYNSTVTCFKHISIGRNCAISWNVNIFDGNVHELIVDGLPRPRTRPVHIGSNVWIGSGVTIMGATIGDGSVVGTGSVVVSEVPGEVVVAGNPARVVRNDISWGI